MKKEREEGGTQQRRAREGRKDEETEGERRIWR